MNKKRKKPPEMIHASLCPVSAGLANAPCVCIPRRAGEKAQPPPHLLKALNRDKRCPRCGTDRTKIKAAMMMFIDTAEDDFDKGWDAACEAIAKECEHINGIDTGLCARAARRFKKAPKEG